MTDKLKMHTPDFTDANIAKLAELFPHCVTEARDEQTGQLEKAIDFDQLRQELSDHVVDGPRERYHLNWPGKREALLAANAPIAKTLRPARDESVDFDTTKNLFIEGDNLDALKLLQETYLNKVKMIYIDPPYNTGKDFLYDDDFSENADEYLSKSQQKDEDGRSLVANSESNGRFHSDWLSMIYSRLRLARNVLTDEGVMFVSIDNHEKDNLLKVCNEVFGASNFIASVAVQVNPRGRHLDRFIAQTHEHIVILRRMRPIRTFLLVLKNLDACLTTMTKKMSKGNIDCLALEIGIKHSTRKLDRISTTRYLLTLHPRQSAIQSRSFIRMKYFLLPLRELRPAGRGGRTR